MGHDGMTAAVARDMRKRHKKQESYMSLVLEVMGLQVFLTEWTVLRLSKKTRFYHNRTT